MAADRCKVETQGEAMNEEMEANESRKNRNIEEVIEEKKIEETSETIHIGKKLGSGSFGELHFAKLSTSEELMAIKLEKKTCVEPKLKREYDIYRTLGPANGIPKIIMFGTCGEHYSLLMELLGHSLNYFHKQCHYKFSVKTTALIALQILDRIEFVHSKGVLYRDVKPENFVFGNTDAKTLYIIDFGLSKRYIDPITKAHVAYSEKCNLVGTARFMSLNTHFGRQQSRRDDLESVGFLLMYFLRGTLPWQNLPVAASEKCRVIGLKKEETTIEDLCVGYPEEFATFLKYSRKLKFEEQPDYESLRNLFRTVLENNNYVEDYVYDWNVLTRTEEENITTESNQ